MKMKTFLPVENKSGFLAITDVLILLSDGEKFYATTSGRKFNLPKGKYLLQGIVQPLEQPLDLDIPFYPDERNDRHYTAEKVVQCNNPNKASVVFENGLALIMIDRSIFKLPKICLCYCYEHELAHARYKLQEGENPIAVENRCDTFAEHRLLERGFNPSQIKYANETLLKNDWRKCNCETRMQNSFGI